MRITAGPFTQDLKLFLYLILRHHVLPTVVNNPRSTINGAVQHCNCLWQLEKPLNMGKNSFILIFEFTYFIYSKVHNLGACK